MLNRYGNHLQRNEYAPRTIYLELTTLKSVNKYLIESRRLNDEYRLKWRLFRPEGSDTYCWSVDEVQAIFHRCDQSPALAWLRPILATLALTGLRIGELATLRWDDIHADQAGHPAFIALTDDRASAKRMTTDLQRRIKGKRGRVVPIHPDLAALLPTLIRQADGMIFHGPKGGRVKPDTVRNIFLRSVIEPLSKQFPKRSGVVGFEDGRLHSFRHYFVSRAFMEGATEAEIKQWVGHRDSRVIELYRHMSDDESRQRLVRLNLLGRSAADGPPQSESSSSGGEGR